MRAVLVTFSLLAIGVTAYAGGVEQPKPASSSSLTQHTYQVGAFNRIVASGYFNLSIQPARTTLHVKTNSYAQDPITVAVHNKTLYLTSNPAMRLHYNAHPTVVVSAANLKGLVVEGPVNVKANKVNSQQLRVTASGYGSITLNQVKDLSAVNQSGNSVLKITGINSQTVTVNEQGYGKLSLQGQVNQLVARVNNQAVLQAKNLKAQHILIQAQHDSEAYVTPVKSIRAFSQNSSEIFYYRHMTNLTRYTVQSGNALQLAW